MIFKLFLITSASILILGTIVLACYFFADSLKNNGN